jgi:hypothetical protein
MTTSYRIPSAKERMFEIPDFPEMRARDIWGLPPHPRNNDEWLEWEPQVQLHRATVFKETETAWSGQQKARETEVARVKKDGRYWQSTYASIYQARPEEDNMSIDLDDDWDTTESGPSGFIVPFIPFLFQLYYWDWQHRAFRTKGPKGDTAIVKSRQMGMSNTVCAIFSHAWMTKVPFQGRLMSRKEDLVDEANNPDSLFWKIRTQLKSQPDWMMQAFAPGFDWKNDSMLASLTNPANANHLAGESTNETAGRGGAATAALLDEYAFMKKGNGIWTATRAMTRHRIAVSTVHLRYGSHFYDLIHPKDNEGPAILRVPYWLHPGHDDLWAEMERQRDTKAGFETEVMMNWYGDESEFVYPTIPNTKLGDYPYLPFMGPVFVTIDDGFSGYWAFHIIQYVHHLGRHRVVDSYRNSHKRADFYGGLFRGIMLPDFDYGDHERKIMEVMTSLQNPIFIMDTHGRHNETVAGMSVIDRLATEWKINVNVDYENREYRDRVEHVERILPYLDWNDTPRTRTARDSCRMYRWREPSEGEQRTTFVKEPVKNHDSHDPTALEYYATNWETYKFIYVHGGNIAYG